MANKIASDMTRMVVVGKLESYTWDADKPAPGKGVIDAGGGNKVRFTIWNRESGDHPHTKATDFSLQYKEGDMVFLSGQDNRQQDQKDASKFYENVNVYDFRMASEEEAKRWAFVYVGTVVSLEDAYCVIGVEDYKKKVTEYPIQLNGVSIPAGFEEGAKVKIKGTVFSGFEADFFGEGQYVTKRNAMVLEVLNTKEEMEAAASGGDSGNGESGLWD